MLSCSADQSLDSHTLDNLRSRVLAREYQLALPDEKRLAKEIEKARRALEKRSRQK